MHSRCSSVAAGATVKASAQLGERGSRLLVKLAVVLLISAAADHAAAQLVVAHRGASHDAPENTLPAFELAWQQRADGVEGDFHLTSDGHIVCIHDADTNRVSNAQHVVAETPLSVLRQIDVGRWKGPQWQDTRMPTFAEVLDIVPPDKWFFIELKTGPEIVPPLAQQLATYDGPRDKLVIISFNAGTLAACAQHLPDIKRHWLTGIKQDKSTGNWRPEPAGIAENVAAARAGGVGIQGRREVVDGAFLNRMQMHGVPEFHVWTIDEPEDARFYSQAGAIGITTNRPALIRDALGHTP